ncbi:PD-(D/E)XK nuclease family protein [Peribacillus alkalitolerans]|uniref:PDDEXK-like family protein n=1 Tax=Peribacillus alkalitolerans TaxID=1550385 RepID=UPI0013D2D6AE|nr:PD-(D/E)XK nuclease family protein [Peribacillus alkalitolerans]
MTYSLESIAFLDHAIDFAKLHQKFNRFNPLKVLRVDHFEIRHSNVLAWLLDSGENHQLGDFFIKKLLSRLLTRSENEEKLAQFDFLQYIYTSFSDVEVYREVKTETGRFIDLLLVAPRHKLVLVIENKFHSSESVGQLDNYITFARSKYKDYTIVPVFLTLNSDTPTHIDYWILDYSDVLEIITLHLELHYESIPDSVYEFLKHYTAILQEELVPDDEMIQLALNVYQSNRAAVDLLYLSQHDEFRNQHRNKLAFQQIDTLTSSEKQLISRIYQKKKQTLDYIYRVGSNVLREAFLSFVQKVEFPEEVYQAHVRVPNFILPDWIDFIETIGEPEKGYWLGHGLIIWFERTWDERLKLNIEVGPIPFENRVSLLKALEKQGISIRPSAKEEGKKYTKIYVKTIDISDWANKDGIVAGMERLYYDTSFKDTIKNIASAIESMQLHEAELEEDSQVEYKSIQSVDRIPKDAFLKFVEKNHIKSDDFQLRNRDYSFVLPLFNDLEQKYGKTREKWWWHNGVFIYWFERLADDRLKLTLELGPLEIENRLKILEDLESLGLNVSSKSKLPSARYTRVYSKSKVIVNWNNEIEVLETMQKLFNEEKNTEILGMLSLL